MLYVERLFEGHAHAELTLTLSHERRQKARQRVVLDNGLEVALRFARGTVLEAGDVLVAVDGSLIQVRAANEELSVVAAPDAWTLARAAYHLGNRHVALQIKPGELSYLRDHVLDQMVEQMGLRVVWQQRPFKPEAGAYGTGHQHLAPRSSRPSAGLHQHVSAGEEETPAEPDLELDAEELTEPNFRPPFVPVHE